MAWWRQFLDRIEGRSIIWNHFKRLNCPTCWAHRWGKLLLLLLRVLTSTYACKGKLLVRSEGQRLKLERSIALGCCCHRLFLIWHCRQPRLAQLLRSGEQAVFVERRRTFTAGVRGCGRLRITIDDGLTSEKVIQKLTTVLRCAWVVCVDSRA